MSDVPPDKRPGRISPDLRKRVLRFFRKGEYKLALALDARLDVEDPPTDEVCIECRLASEFFIKSFLLSQKEKYRKFGHDIEAALDKCIEIDPAFQELSDICVDLNNYKLEIEYDLSSEESIKISETIKCREYALTVHDFVRNRLAQIGFFG